MKDKLKWVLKANYQQILFVVLAFLAMVLVSYFYVSDIVRGQMRDLGEETMNTIQTAVSSSLSETELIFANTTQQVEGMLEAGSDNEEVLHYLAETNSYFADNRSPMPDFLKVYGYIRGEFLDGSGWVPPDDYTPTERPWYIGAKKLDGKIFFSEPYIDADTGGMCISFSQQLFDHYGNYYGVLAIDLNLTRITDYVASQKIANNGYGVLLSDRLYFTTHRDPEVIGKTMTEAGGDYVRLAEILEADEAMSALRFTDRDGTDSIAYFRTIFNGWHIGVITPRASYYSQVTTMGWVLGVLGVVLMLMLSYMLVRTRVEKMRSEEESKSKSGFLARMSHEMRTPMNAIIGMTEIARQTSEMSKIQYCLTRIHDAADHLLGVINDVLDMSKIEAGKLELYNTDFTVQSLIEQVTTVVGFKIDERKQRFAIKVADDVPKAIVSDKQRLAQVITNLLSNANKFTPEEGHIDLSISRLEDKGGLCTLRVEVADDGIGLSAEQQSRLFRSFEQADNSISRKYGGTGLGLAITKKIIDLMDGEATIESELGGGAKFIFVVRVGEGAAREGEELTLSGRDLELPDFTGRRLLLAEDVEINREILLTLLEGTGVEIDTVENGRAACEQFAANPGRYDMIFMDIHMPEMDGYEATRKIRAMDLAQAQTVPIVAMTANVFREDVESSLAAGMDAHVGKPIELDEVLEKMKRFMP